MGGSMTAARTRLLQQQIGGHQRARVQRKVAWHPAHRVRAPSMAQEREGGGKQVTAVIVTTPDQLQAIIAEAVASGIAAATARQTMNVTDVAAMLGVSTRTVRRMELDGELPPKSGRYWDRKALDKWRKDRA